MRTAQYVAVERKIVGADGDGITHRWHYGGRLLADPLAMTPSGKSLRNGVPETLIEAARKKGIELTSREIQRRLQCARAYTTEAQLRQALTQLGTWDAMLNAGFPPFEPDNDGPPADHRTDEERRHDAARDMLEMQQATLFDLRRFEPRQSTLKDLIDYEREQHEITQRFVAVDQRRHDYVQTLLGAVGGDESRIWQDAHDIAYPDTPPGDDGNGALAI